MKKQKSKLNEAADAYIKMRGAKKAAMSPIEGSPAEEAAEAPEEEIQEDGPPTEKKKSKKNLFKKSM